MRISINDIDLAAAYEGYLWMSDRPRPYVLQNESVEDVCPDCFKTVNPFVVEGYLYDREHGLSYSIKQIDGEYWVIRTHVCSGDSQELHAVPLNYVSHRLPGVKELKFVQYWRPCKDPLCLDMDVLQPAEMVFVGFVKVGENGHD